MPSKSHPHASLVYDAQLTTLVDEPPEGDEWLREQKFDGYRQGLREDERAKNVVREQRDRT